MSLFHIITVGWSRAVETAYAVATFCTGGICCPDPNLPCPTSETFVAYVGRIATGISGALLGIVTAMLIFYSLKLAVSGNDESHTTEVRQAYLHVLFGAVLVTGAAFIASLVPAYSAVAQPGSFIVNVLKPVGDFFFFMIGGALVINIGYHGFRLIIGQDDNALNTARQGIVRGVLGLTAVVIAGTAVGAFQTANMFFLTDELLGVGSFLITLLGALAVVSVVIAGFFLIISADEQLKDRSKKIIITVAVAIIVVMASRIILSAFF